MTLRSSTVIMGLLLATAAAGGMLACSSAEEQPAEEAAPAPERSQDETQPAPLGSNTNSTPAPPSDPDPAPAAAGDAGAGEGGGTGNGTGTGTGGGNGGGPGKMCEAASVKEVEDNNTAGTATPVPGASGSACGQLSSKADVDFFKFTLPADTTGFAMGLNYSRNGLKIEVTADGKSFEIGQTPELLPGKEYVVKVTTTGDAPVDYRWNMTVDK